jgi:hypothetical protein
MDSTTSDTERWPRSDTQYLHEPPKEKTLVMAVDLWYGVVAMLRRASGFRVIDLFSGEGRLAAVNLSIIEGTAADSLIEVSELLSPPGGPLT